MQRLLSTILFVLAASSSAGAYHFGQRPASRGTMHGPPAIVRLTSEWIEFISEPGEPVTLAIYDLRGSAIMVDGVLAQRTTPSDGRGMLRVSLRSLPPGFYLLTLANGAGITAQGVAGVR